MGSAAIGSAGKIAETCITAYEAFKSVISGLTPSTTIYDITATYACAALEQVSFTSTRLPMESGILCFKQLCANSN